MADTKLKQIRESLGVTQETVAKRLPTINLRTYIRAEGGKTTVRYATAQEILVVINDLLREAGRDPVTLDDLELKLF
jgi:DNA-binding XRE family transcriptional regulator